MAGATPSSLKAATDDMVSRVQADIARLRDQVNALQNKGGLSPEDQAALDAAEASIKALDPADPSTLTNTAAPAMVPGSATAAQPGVVPTGTSANTTEAVTPPSPSPSPIPGVPTTQAEAASFQAPGTVVPAPAQPAAPAPAPTGAPAAPSDTGSTPTNTGGGTTGGTP